MAVKDKDTKNKPVVTRVKAQDESAPKKSAPKSGSKTEVKKSTVRRKRLGFLGKIFGGLIGYFKGAWFELRQVRWPNRRATWSMTGALLGFTAFFIAFILLIDVLFEYLFKLVVG